MRYKSGKKKRINIFADDAIHASIKLQHGEADNGSVKKLTIRLYKTT